MPKKFDLTSTEENTSFPNLTRSCNSSANLVESFEANQEDANRSSHNNNPLFDGKDVEAFYDVEESPPSYKEKDTESENEDKKIDKFDIKHIEIEDTSTPWSELSTGKKVLRVLMIIAGICLALGLLYIFICSLDVLQAAFQLLAGRVAGDALSSNVILNNPIAGLVLGVLATVLLQSSSTSTSIVVSLVGSRVLTVQQAIYIIMGSNIGTSVTNTIVSLSQSMEKESFRRSFAGATVHDMFNWLTVIILLPLEAASGYLNIMTKAIVKNIKTKNESASDSPQFLKVITDPLTGRIVKIDKAVMSAVAGGTDRAKYPLCKYYCDMVYDNFEESWPMGQENQTYIDNINDQPWTIDVKLENDTSMDRVNLTWRDINPNESELCTHHFTGCGVEGTWCSLNDQAVGGILFACSLIILLAAVITMVKVLNLILRGPMAKAIRVGINAELPGKAKFLTGYIAMLIGAGVTMLVQSSSVFTSTLTPLVGMGLISIERMYPLTLGSNIGTCLTSVLAALTADASEIKNTLQVSLAHIFFNISGIILFYPLPWLRVLPLKAAKFLGNTTAEYRWFAIAYLIVLFFLIPGAIFALSVAGWQALVGVLVPIGAIIIAIVVVKCMQHFCPQKMHPCMRNWHWLPKPLRSLEPCNSAILKCCYNDSCVNCRKKCCGDDESDCEDGDRVDLEKTPAEIATVDETTLGIPLSMPIPNGIGHQDEGHLNPAYEDSEVNHITHSTAL